MFITYFVLNSAFNMRPGTEQHVTHPALGPGRVFVWVTWLAPLCVSTKINLGAFIKRPLDCGCLCSGASLPSATVTPAHSAQTLQFWPTKSSRLGTRRSRAAITFTARSRTAIITARQATYVISRVLDRMGTSSVRVPGTDQWHSMDDIRKQIRTHWTWTLYGSVMCNVLCMSPFQHWRCHVLP